MMTQALSGYELRVLREFTDATLDPLPRGSALNVSIEVLKSRDLLTPDCTITPAGLAAIQAAEDERAKRLAAFKRAADRARVVLQPGDRITFTSCPGTKRWGIFEGWERDWIRTRTLDDVSASTITKVNGRLISFRDPADLQ